MVDAPDPLGAQRSSRAARWRGCPTRSRRSNEPFPNDYAAEFIPILAAYALLQDWDGLFFYAYGGGTEEQWRDAGRSSAFSPWPTTRSR